MIVQTQACIGFAGILNFAATVAAKSQTQCLQSLIIEDLWLFILFTAIWY